MLKIKIYIFLCLLFLSACTLQQDNTKDISYLAESEIEKPKEPTFRGVKRDNDKTNILVVGIDSRGEEQSRSDAIMVVQVNPTNKQLKLVSIMRDSYVEIPGYSKGSNKINLAYFLGGAELLRQTIKQNFDIDTHHYVTIDFEGFVKVVDIVAPEGIEVNINQTIIDDMNLDLNPGIQKLHGEDLLAYARFRHDSESDFGRVERQQEVLTNLKNEFVTQLSTIDGLFKLPSIGDEVFQYIDTDMDLKTLISLGGDVLFNQVKKIETMRIPISEGLVDKEYEHAGMVLEMDIPKNKQILKEFLVDEPTPVTKDTSN